MMFLETLRSHLTYDSYHHQHSSSADCFTKIKRRGRGGLASGAFYLTSLKMMIMVFSTPISVPTQSSSSSPYRFLTPYLPVRTFFTRKKFLIPCLSNHESRDERSNDNQSDDTLRRKILIFFSAATILFPISSSLAKTKGKNPYDEKRLLEQNKRIQRENNAPDDFPSFVREGFEVKVVTSENYVKRNSGLIYRDFEVGKGDCPEDGQQVMFHYVGYNESGRRIDSTYIQGAPARIRMGTNALVPGFEEGIRDMRPGGKRRIIIPPELGPPVGPSTFFSSKQFEVFDVELLSIQQCQRRSIAFYSDFVCS